MLIDWFTVAAQLLNFMLLVWLMKRFLYRPVLDAIAAREKSIADECASADAKSQQARQEKATFEEHNRQFAQQRDEQWQQATVAAEAERQRLLDAARLAVTALEDKSRQAMQSMEQALCQAVSEQVQHELFAMAAKALRDLADTELMQQMVLLFMQRLQQLEPSQQQALCDAIEGNTTDDSTNGKPLTILSSQALDNHLQSQLVTALRKFSSDELSIKFVISAALICGISLETEGFKLSWNVADYLAELHSSLAGTIDAAQSSSHVVAVGSDAPLSPSGAVDQGSSS